MDENERDRGWTERGGPRHGRRAVESLDASSRRSMCSAMSTMPRSADASSSNSIGRNTATASPGACVTVDARRTHRRLPGRARRKTRRSRPHAQRDRLLERHLHASRRREPPSSRTLGESGRTRPRLAPCSSAHQLPRPLRLHASRGRRPRRTPVSARPQFRIGLLQRLMSVHRSSRTHGPGSALR